jgi:hypothetical protein
MPWRIPTLLVFAALAGCEGKPYLVGTWSFPLPRMPMTIEFKPDGTYEGKATGGRTTLKGKYSIESNLLILDPPQIQGETADMDAMDAFAGAMKLKMEPLGPGAYRLSAPPQLSFVMSRMGRR